MTTAGLSSGVHLASLQCPIMHESHRLFWTRPHRNGMNAVVFERQRDSFAVGAFPETNTGPLTEQIRGNIREAQSRADAMSNCPQPCQCPPWRE
jgi:hypothetical protein